VDQPPVLQEATGTALTTDARLRACDGRRPVAVDLSLLGGRSPARPVLDGDQLGLGRPCALPRRSLDGPLQDRIGSRVLAQSVADVDPIVVQAAVQVPCCFASRYVEPAHALKP
jgi:hypothetical protein